MHEDVLARLRRDKAKALLGVEPLHGSNRHVLVPPSLISEVSTNARPATAHIRRWADVLLPTPAPSCAAGWTCGVSQRMLPRPNGGSLCATRSVPSSSSRPITAQPRQADQMVVPKVSGRRRRAADGQQPVSVTTGECARKPWRIMTADLWHRWPLTWRSSHAFTILNTTQFLARRLRADLARRKS